MIPTKVIHSQTNPAWNVVGTKLGGKYKIAIVPYESCIDKEIESRLRKEAYDHAMFISNAFNAEAK
jgi:hypothetical protein